MGLKSILYDVRSHGHGYAIVAGHFLPQGTSAIDNDDTVGQGFTVARDDVGDFTVTFDQQWPSIVYAQAQVQLATEADTVAMFKTLDVTATTPTATLTTLTAGVAADISADPDNRVHLLFIMRNTVVTT